MTFPVKDFLESGAIIGHEPDKVLIGWGTPQRKKTKELSSQHPYFYFNDFFLSISSPWLHFSNNIEITLEEFQSLIENFPESHVKSEWGFYGFEKFKESFHSLLEHIQHGEIDKGVPYVFSHSSQNMSKNQLVVSLKNAIEQLKKKAGTLYGTWNNQAGILGITPELLFNHNQNNPHVIQTMALAGTCSLHEDLNQFLNNYKEMKEHQFVIEGIRQSIGRFGKVNCGSLQLLKLPHLSHLLTPIEIQLNSDFDFDFFLQDMHPTPALGAYPKQNGKKWLEDFQKHTPRGMYGAPFGYFLPSKKELNCYVGIRNVQWDKKGMHIGAGCGVVKESTFDQEWKEIQLKIHSIKDQFQL